MPNWLRIRARLAVLAVPLGLALACAGDDAASEGPWQLRVDTVQAGGGARMTSWLRTVGREGPVGKTQADTAILSFDCYAEAASTTIMTDQALRQGSAEATVTVDGAAPREVPAFAGTTSSGGQVVLTIPQDSMLALLSGHQQVAVEYADGAGSSRTTATFPIGGLERHRAAFQAACAQRGAETR
jgi:hypothetical protein